jgi:peroxiredoxin
MSTSTSKKQATNASPATGGSSKTATYIVWGLASVAILAAGLLFLNSSTPDQAAPITANAETAGAAATTATAAAPAFELPLVGGGTASLEQYRGSVVMLNFWATWCGPCKREIPDFIELQKQYADKGFTILGVALDEPADVAAFTKANGINYPILLGDNEISNAYGGIRSIPTTVLIDREGNIVSTDVGMLPKEHWQEAIARLL